MIKSRTSLKLPGSESGAYIDDPLALGSAVLTKLRTQYMGLTYPFAVFGRRVSIHYSADIRRSSCNRICIGDSVYIAAQTWLNIPEPALGAPPAIIVGNGCRIGRRCMISAKTRVQLGEDVLLGPSVLITDHSHEFSNPNMPIHMQGLTAGGSVYIEKNCWLGHGSVVVGASGDVIIGQNSVIGANSVVTQSVPQFSVVVGSPARVIRHFDPASGNWVKGRTVRDVTDEA